MNTIGEIFSHYKIVSKLGAGGMGEVYLAKDTKLERLAALRVLSAEVPSDAGFIKRFMQKASALIHLNILTVYEFSEVGGVRFMTSQYVKRLSLAEYLRSGKPFLENFIKYQSKSFWRSKRRTQEK